MFSSFFYAVHNRGKHKSVDRLYCIQQFVMRMNVVYTPDHFDHKMLLFISLLIINY